MPRWKRACPRRALTFELSWRQLRETPLVLSLSEGLGRIRLHYCRFVKYKINSPIGAMKSAKPQHVSIVSSFAKR